MKDYAPRSISQVWSAPSSLSGTVSSDGVVFGNKDRASIIR
jgi:hypothetical protein